MIKNENKAKTRSRFHIFFASYANAFCRLCEHGEDIFCKLCEDVEGII